ncbi:MAG TPA: radical SAM protein [bacterium]|nr:radical SAM protein [bacterium]
MTRDSLTFCGLTAVDPADRSQYQPLCYAYLSAYAKRYAPWVKVVVARTAAEAVAAKPDVVGVSASSVNIAEAYRLARAIRRATHAPLVLGGVHVSALPHTLSAPFDVGVIGEGEQTFVELMTHVREHGRLVSEKLEAIAGLAVREGDAVRLTAPRAPIADLSTVPLPDRAVLGGDWTNAQMVTSRGCPYACRFCSSKKMWGSFRAFPAEMVLNEIDDLVENHGARAIHFFDDLFVADRKRLAAVADGVVARGYPGRIAFSCTVRAELADEEMFALLARMQVRRVTFGAESNSPRILQWLKGAGANVAANRRTLDLARQHGMVCSPSFIKGAPGETGDDLLATYEFILRGIRERKIDYFEVHCLTPFPGTPIWDLAKARGAVDEAMDFTELRVPWERQYLNEALPKTSFYFFENLTQLGMRWLGMTKRRLIALVDVSHGAQHFAELARQLDERGICDEHLAVAFHGEVDLTPLQTPGWRVGGPELLNGYLKTDDPSLLFVYLRPDEGVDVARLNAQIWRHFDSGADLTLHSGFRHFAPATPFERSIAVAGQRGLRAGLEIFGRDETPLETLRRRGLNVAAYRPDDDPFAPASETARLFADLLKRDFGIDRPWAGREKMFAAVEERIVTDAARLPQREARKRKIDKLLDSLKANARRRLRGE